MQTRLLSSLLAVALAQLAACSIYIIITTFTFILLLLITSQIVSLISFRSLEGVKMISNIWFVGSTITLQSQWLQVEHGSLIYNGWARVAQWWEHSPPTNVVRVRILASTPYVGWVCCWFSPLLREVFLRVLRFSPLLKNQHFEIPIRSWTHGHVSTSSYELLSAPWVNKLQFFFLQVIIPYANSHQVGGRKLFWFTSRMEFFLG